MSETKSRTAESIESIYSRTWRPIRMENSVFLQSPFTYQTSWFSTRYGTRCEFFETQWLECASKVGAGGALSACKDEKDDLVECITNAKGYKRFMRMQEERQKRGVPYQNPPPVDTVQFLKYKNAIAS